MLLMVFKWTVINSYIKEKNNLFSGGKKSQDLWFSFIQKFHYLCLWPKYKPGHNKRKAGLGILPIALQNQLTHSLWWLMLLDLKEEEIAYSLIDCFEAEIPLSNILGFIRIVMVFEVAGLSQTCSFLLQKIMCINIYL